METLKIKIKDDYSEYTGPRYCNQGKSSGEDFYHTKLNGLFAKSIEENTFLTVDLDDTAGYLSSFLDEAFGNLVFDFTLEKVKKHLKVISLQEPDWNEMITKEVFTDWENRRKANNKPKKTIEHPSWVKYIENKLETKSWI